MDNDLDDNQIEGLSSSVSLSGAGTHLGSAETSKIDRSGGRRWIGVVVAVLVVAGVLAGLRSFGPKTTPAMDGSDELGLLIDARVEDPRAEAAARGGSYYLPSWLPIDIDGRMSYAIERPGREGGTRHDGAEFVVVGADVDGRLANLVLVERAAAGAEPWDPEAPGTALGVQLPLDGQDVENGSGPPTVSATRRTVGDSVDVRFSRGDNSFRLTTSAGALASRVISGIAFGHEVLAIRETAGFDLLQRGVGRSVDGATTEIGWSAPNGARLLIEIDPGRLPPLPATVVAGGSDVAWGVVRGRLVTTSTAPNEAGLPGALSVAIGLDDGSVVTLTGTYSVADLVRIAESLEQVDRESWLTQVPLVDDQPPSFLDGAADSALAPSLDAASGLVPPDR